MSEAGDKRKRIGAVGLVIKLPACNGLKVQRVLAEHARLIVGRLEVPLPTRSLTVMALIIEATTDEVGALTGQLGSLPNVRVKTSLV